MMTPTRRKYLRYSDHVPIFYAGFNSQNYSRAVMHNSCVDGMYFELDAPLQPKFDLYTKVSRHRPICFGPEPYKAYRTKVKWCRQLTGGKIPRYGIGAQFTAKSHLSYGTNIYNSAHICDFCEEKVTDRLIHQTETRLLLCPECLHYMETLPIGIEESLERFLLGNVVSLTAIKTILIRISHRWRRMKGRIKNKNFLTYKEEFPYGCCIDCKRFSRPAKTII